MDKRNVVNLKNEFVDRVQDPRVVLIYSPECAVRKRFFEVVRESGKPYQYTHRYQETEYVKFTLNYRESLLQLTGDKKAVIVFDGSLALLDEKPEKVFPQGSNNHYFRMKHA